MSVKGRDTQLNIPMLIACVLLCLTMISIHMTSGLYSRYVSTGEGSDSARVIKFGKLNLEESGDFVYDSENLQNDFVIIPGVDLKKKATVSFDGSEAATYVFVEVELSDNWTGPDTFKVSSTDGTTAYMTWKIADGWTYLGQYEKGYVYYKALEPNTKLDKADIVAEEGKIEVSSQIPTITGNNNINDTYIKFHAKVVQANGFENVTQAWASISGK